MSLVPFSSRRCCRSWVSKLIGSKLSPNSIFTKSHLHLWKTDCPFIAYHWNKTSLRESLIFSLLFSCSEFKHDFCLVVGEEPIFHILLKYIIHIHLFRKFGLFLYISIKRLQYEFTTYTTLQDCYTIQLYNTTGNDTPRSKRL